MKTETYTQAFERLQKIVSQIESGELDIDQLADMIKEANKLIAFCNDKLTKADEEIKKLSQEKQ
jgi:exodeoxyribonuclease VII small subunit